MSRKESLVRGAIALASAGLIIKVSNLFVRIPLTRLIDAEGIGIYQMALPAFWALYHLAAGGVPVAVQNLVAEYTARGKYAVADQVVRMALIFTALAGGAASLFLFFCAPFLAKMLGEPRVAWPLIALAPAVFLSAVDSIYRNYLQGRKLMTPSASASVLEQGTKVLAMIVAAYLMLPRGKAAAAGGAAFGITAGTVVSLIYMAVVCRRIRREDGRANNGGYVPRSSLARRMISLAWPVTFGSVTMPLLNLVDVGIVQRGFLRAGYAQSAATSLYGAYSGIAVQVVWFPFVLTNALANALGPVLSAAKARNDRETIKERVLLGLRATALVCLPVSVGVAILAGPIAGLFGDPMAVPPLLFLAPVAFLGPLMWLLIVQLQALGRTGLPMRNMAIAMVVKIGLDALLAPIRGVDVRGVAIASTTMFLVGSYLNARALEDELDEPLPWGWILRGPLLASVTMGLALFGLAAAGWLPSPGAAAIGVAAVVAPPLYLATLLVSGALNWQELKGLSGPLGPKLERWFHTIWPWS